MDGLYTFAANSAVTVYNMSAYKITGFYFFTHMMPEIGDLGNASLLLHSILHLGFVILRILPQFTIQALTHSIQSA